MTISKRESRKIGKPLARNDVMLAEIVLAVEAAVNAIETVLAKWPKLDVLAQSNFA